MLHPRMLLLATMAFASIATCSAARKVLRTLTEADAGTTVKMVTGDSIDVRLPAQMGTGQRWIALANPHIHVSEQALQGADKPGGTEQQIFEVTAIEAGVSALTFEYRRSWMPEERAARQFLLTLDISPH